MCLRGYARARYVSQERVRHITIVRHTHTHHSQAKKLGGVMIGNDSWFFE
jgi:hypothetical protein